MFKYFLACILLVLTNITYAGDYMLYVYKTSADECKYHRVAKFIDENCDKQKPWQSCEVSLVNKDIEKYLNNDTELKISTLAASVTNGHISFCSREAKSLFQTNLLALKGKIKNERHLKEFIKMYASN